MGRKQNNSKKPQQESQQQEQIQSQSKQQSHGQDQQSFDSQQQSQNKIDGDQVILKKIQDKIIDADDQEKLSWAAIYQIKKQQALLNEQMQKQIDLIKEKYEEKKIPLMTKVADAVAGKKLEKHYYSENQQCKSINLNKTKPAVIKDYWSKVFDSSGLVENQDDIQLLQKITLFRCQLIDPKVQNIKLTFEFEQNNDYFEKSIQISVMGSIAEGNFSKDIKFTPKKQSKTLDENSLFGLLIGKDSDDQELLDTCHDLYRAYVSSTYFYFYQPDEDINEQNLFNEQNDEDQSQSEDQNQDDIKPVKKTKGSAITQKPECKQQ